MGNFLIGILIGNILTLAVIIINIYIVAIRGESKYDGQD